MCLEPALWPVFSFLGKGGLLRTDFVPQRVSVVAVVELVKASVGIFYKEQSSSLT